LLGISLSCQVPRKKEILIRKLKEQGFKDDEVKKLMNEISTLVFFNQSAEKNKTVHVVVFGRSNVGKSSLVNLLTDSNLETAANAAGCTIKTTKNCYIRNSITYHLYDTAGLNEAGGGRVEKIDAICKLIDSFKRIKKINMVAYVRKCDTLTELDEKNYNLIIRILLQNRVKSLCINTYADNEEEQMDWLERNGKSFETRSMKFSKGVSVIVGKPKNQELQAVYDNRLRKAKTILLDAIDECRSEPIDFSQVKWIDFFLEMINHYCGTRFEVNQPRDVEHLKKKLVDAGFKDDEADKLTGELKTLLLINNQRQKQDDSNSDSDENNLSS
jgi:GTP-binding protein EngB required for normal cell division